MATILSAKDLESFKRIPVPKAGRKGKFSHLSGMLREFSVGSVIDITEDLDSDAFAIVERFVRDYGNVTAEDRTAVRGILSAFIREMRKLEESADCEGSYYLRESDDTVHYAVKRTA